MTVNKQEPIFQLRIDLQHLRPPIWRRVLVPASASLDDLHEIIQAIMPWWDAHLHEFECNGAQYGIPRDDPWYEIGDSRAVVLSEVLFQVGAHISYTYDFGDTWGHKIKLEKVLDPAPDMNYPFCVTGRRACPPEDCGGPPGYEAMLQALADPDNDDHEMYREWVGDDFDPEAFDLNEANDGLAEFSLAGAADPFEDLLPMPRFAVVIKPRKPVFDWARTLPESSNITWEEAQNASVAILIPVIENEEEFQAYFVENVVEWIPLLFSVWTEEREAWPDELRGNSIDIQKWVEIEMHPLVFDAAMDDTLENLMESGLGQMFASMLASMDDDEPAHDPGLL